jgi:hypothetical protein
VTRATLLHVLDHTTAISPAEVRELEQLAQAFPYCQTAHLLLAKAAHDQGTMLAGQRLRRAATYAANRELLRHLIEQVAEAPTPTEEAVEPVAAQAAPEPVAAPVAGATTAIPEPAAPAVLPEPVMAAAPLEAAILPEPVAAAIVLPQPAEEVIPAPLASPAELSVEEPALAEPLAVMANPAVAEVPAESVAEESDDLPAAAPPIRPPAELGAARFEFGLNTGLPAVTAYKLPELADELELLTPEAAAADALAAEKGPAASIFSDAAFTGDVLVGYGLGMGSRLGFALESFSEAQAPGMVLPPTGVFFEPDVMLTEYWAAHCQRTAPSPTSLDLINNFLRRQPRLTRPAAAPSITEAQADLSMRSTRPEADLASESLARILARQGKNERAIEIYQRLMVKQPEKMAYFAAQIQSLQPPA